MRLLVTTLLSISLFLTVQAQSTLELVFNDDWFYNSFKSKPLLPTTSSDKNIAKLVIDINSVTGEDQKEQAEAQIIQEFDQEGRLIRQQETRYVHIGPSKAIVSPKVLNWVFIYGDEGTQLFRYVGDPKDPGEQRFMQASYDVIEKQPSDDEKITEFFNRKLGEFQPNPSAILPPPRISSDRKSNFPPPPPPPPGFQSPKKNTPQPTGQIARIFSDIKKDSILNITSYLPSKKGLHSVVITKSLKDVGEYVKGDFFYIAKEIDASPGLAYFRLYSQDQEYPGNMIVSERKYDAKANAKELPVLYKEIDITTGRVIEKRLPIGTVICPHQYQENDANGNWLSREVDIQYKWNKDLNYKQIHRRKLSFHGN